MAFSAPAPRGWAAIVVLLAWAASLGWLGMRQFGHPDNDTLSGEASLRLAPGDAWLAVMAGDVQVGTAGVTLDTLSPGFRILESSTLELPNDTGLVHSARFTRIVVGPTLSLQELSTSWGRPGRRSAMSLGMVGHELEAHYPPSPATPQFRSKTPLTLLHVFPYQLALAKGLRADRDLKLMLIEGWPASARLSRIRIGHDTTVTYPDSTIFDGASGTASVITSLQAEGVSLTVDGISGPYRVTIDKRGRLQGLETLLGVRWVRGNFELSMNAFRQGLPANTQRIRAAYPVVRPLVTARPMADSNVERRFLVSHRDGSPVAADLLKLLEGGRQRIRGDTLIVQVSTTPQSDADASIGSEAESVDPLIPNFSRFADPKVRQTVEGLAKYVAERVAMDTAGRGTEDGRTAFETRRGRADAIVRLFIGAARASDMTARYVVGVRPVGDTLYTHAWAEVRNSRGEWLAVDPAFGRADASTSLIRLGWGGSSLPDDMMPILANARFTPVPSGPIP